MARDRSSSPVKFHQPLARLDWRSHARPRRSPRLPDRTLRRQLTQAPFFALKATRGRRPDRPTLAAARWTKRPPLRRHGGRATPSVTTATHAAPSQPGHPSRQFASQVTNPRPLDQTVEAKHRRPAKRKRPPGTIGGRPHRYVMGRSPSSDWYITRLAPNWPR